MLGNSTFMFVIYQLVYWQSMLIQQNQYSEALL